MADQVSSIGKPPHQKTDENIKIATSLASYGVPTIQIAAALDISEPTLFKYYKDDMIKARALANGKIGQTIYQKARSGDTRALIWWSKTQMGWRDYAKSIEMHDYPHQININFEDGAQQLSDENESFEIMRPIIHPKDQQILERLGVLENKSGVQKSQ